MADASLRVDSESGGVAHEAPRRAEYGLEPIRTTTSAGFIGYWIAGMFLGAILYAVVAFSFINYRTDHDAEWIGFMYMQKKVAVERRSGPGLPRLLIVGGSGALFGIDAQLIERKLPVRAVNYATHAGLGFRYLLNRAQRELRQGDIVVLAPEYDTWNDSFRDDVGPAMKFLWTYDKNYFIHQEFYEQFKMLTSIEADDWGNSLYGWRQRFSGINFDVTDLTRFNVGLMDGNGDLRYIVPGKPTQPKYYDWAEEPSKQRQNEILGFAQFAKAHGIRVFLTWPNRIFPAPAVPDSNTVPPTWLSEFIKQAGFIVLDTPTENAYPYDWFMDTYYHINPCGRRIRTEELIRRLRPQLGLAPLPDKVTGIYLVAGTEHRLTDGNLFLNDPGIVVKYLRPEEDYQWGTMTPPQVADLVNHGMPVYTDSDDAAPLLATVKLGTKRQWRGSMWLTDWFKQYPSHVFLLAAAVDHAVDPAWQKLVPDVVPAEVYRRLASVWGPTVAIFGTKGYRGTYRVHSNYVVANLDERLDELVPHKTKVMPAVLELKSGAMARITVDSMDIIESVPGVCVVVIDPRIGSVVDRVVIQPGAPDVETWHMDRVIPLTEK